MPFAPLVNYIFTTIPNLFSLSTFAFFSPLLTLLGEAWTLTRVVLTRKICSSVAQGNTATFFFCPCMIKILNHVIFLFFKLLLGNQWVSQMSTGEKEVGSFFQLRARFVFLRGDYFTAFWLPLDRGWYLASCTLSLPLWKVVLVKRVYI